MKERTVLVQVVLTEPEKLRLDFELKHIGFSRSAFLRKLLLDYFENHSPHHGNSFQQKQLEVTP